MLSIHVIETCFYIIQCLVKNCAKYSLNTISFIELRESEELINLSKKIIGDIEIIVTNIEIENINVSFNQIIAQHI